MPGATWGAPGGISEGITDTRNMALEQLAQGETAMQPLKAMGLAAQTARMMAETDKINTELMGEKRYAESLAHIGQGRVPPNALPGNAVDGGPAGMYGVVGGMFDDAELALKSGAFDMYNKKIAAAGTMLGHVSAAMKNNAQERQANLNVALSQADTFDRVFSDNIQTVPQLQAALQKVANLTGEPAPSLRVDPSKPFDVQAAVQDIRKTSGLERSKLLTEYQKQELAQRSVDKAATDAYRKARIDQKNTEIAATAAEKAAKLKAGGPVKSASDREIGITKRLLEDAAPGLGNSGDVATSMAMQALRLMGKNSALSFDEATAQIIQTAKRSGELRVENVDRSIPGATTVFGQTQKSTYSVAVSGERAGGKFVAGKLYYDSYGTVRQYDPVKFKASGGWSPILGHKDAQ